MICIEPKPVLSEVPTAREGADEGSKTATVNSTEGEQGRVENIREKKRIDQREYPISNDEVCSRWRSENEAYPGRTAPQEDNGDRGTEVPLNK